MGFEPTGSEDALRTDDEEDRGGPETPDRDEDPRRRQREFEAKRGITREGSLDLPEESRRDEHDETADEEHEDPDAPTDSTDRE